jgi:HemK-like putative methylase
MGQVTFDGLRLLTAPGRVMIPRATSEQLVVAAREHLGEGGARVVDVGTGSGAIALAIAHACPRAHVWATDTSEAAVALARANVRRHRLGGRVHVRLGDLLEPVAGRFDLIAANLPYLAASLAAARPELQAEPFDAVFAPGGGLGPYRRLLDQAASRLADDGVLLFQLHRHVLTAACDELPALRAALTPVPFQALAGKAA